FASLRRCAASGTASGRTKTSRQKTTKNFRGRWGNACFMGRPIVYRRPERSARGGHAKSRDISGHRRPIQVLPHLARQRGRGERLRQEGQPLVEHAMVDDRVG